ncbi:MAG TPA: hypothetical protein VNS63_18755 [Blastocatellia bacterium]|nr:hypothetical protein [Blastocatellia bacterium]
MRLRFATAYLSLGLFLAPFQGAHAQDPGQSLDPNPQVNRTTQKSAQREQADNQEARQDPSQEMRQAISLLTAEINSLSGEVQRLRKVTERNAQTIELLLNEERLSKLEDKVQEATDHKAQLDAREQDIQRRMRNIPGETILRGGVRRDEAEAVVKAELQRALDDVHNQQSNSQQRITELNIQTERLRARVEMLRKRVEQQEPKGEKQNQ